MENTIEQPRKKVGLALGGGFIRSTCQIGVIEVLEENGIPIDYLAACSSGSIVASAYCAGTLKFLKRRLAYGSRHDYWSIIIEPSFSFKGILKGVRNRKFFEEFVGDDQFSDLKKPLAIATMDIIKLEPFMVQQGSVSKAVQAATSVPGFFVPVEWDDKQLVDGGNFNLIPSNSLYEKGADYVIAVGAFKKPNFITRFFSNYKQYLSRERILEKNGHKNSLNYFEIIGRTFALSASQIENFSSDPYRYDILITPDLHKIKRIHVQLVQYCIEQGRQAALEAVPKIKKDLGII